ncbi:MAG: HTTM domain-containing protein [Chitinophagales bacterium]
MKDTRLEKDNQAKSPLWRGDLGVCFSKLSFQNTLKKLTSTKTSILPLVTFRILFGILMAISTIRFWANGWIEDLYITPSFHFKFYGFHWIENIGEPYIYFVFAFILLTSILIVLGLFYRAAIITFFFLFTYVELIDATNYLNHYYFISLIAFLMIWLPANQHFALDTYIFKKKASEVSAWTINILKLQIGILYFYAGIAKLNSDWLFQALPMKIWLPAHENFPLLGHLFTQQWTAYAFSWAGAFFDITIFFFLISKKTRPWAYLAIVGFHLMTWLLFPIGMFPFFMIGLTLIFFSANFHKQLLSFFGLNKVLDEGNHQKEIFTKKTTKLTVILLSLWIGFHLLFPFRYVLYNNSLFWTEQGYRFSWRVMLMEKAGYATFYIKDSASDRVAIADNSRYLQPNQEKMMSTQPDFILQYAHLLAEDYTRQGFVAPSVTAEIYVTLNGRPSQLFIDKDVNLAQINDSFSSKNWILPLK